MSELDCGRRSAGHPSSEREDTRDGTNDGCNRNGTRRDDSGQDCASIDNSLAGGCPEVASRCAAALVTQLQAELSGGSPRSLPFRSCAWCASPVLIVFRPGRPRLYCAHTCRQRAYEHRHGFHHPRTVLPLPGQSSEDNVQHGVRSEATEARAASEAGLVPEVRAASGAGPVEAANPASEASRTRAGSTSTARPTSPPTSAPESWAPRPARTTYERSGLTVLGKPFHALRTSVRPEGGRRESLCGLLVRPGNGQAFEPSRVGACKSCAAAAARAPLALSISLSNELARLRAVILETAELRHRPADALDWLLAQPFSDSAPERIA